MAALTWADQGGGTFANPELSKEARMIAALKSKFFDIVEPAGDLALNKNHGDTVALKIWGRISGTATTPLSETSPVPFGTLPEYTVTAQMYQRGFALAYTGMREDLDRLSIETPVIHALKEHSSRTHNKLIYDALVAGRSFCYSATSATEGTFTSNGTPSGTQASLPKGFHIRAIVKNLRKLNTPAFDGENYVAVGSPTFCAGLFEDATTVTGFVDVKKYTSSADGLLNGEIGKYFGVRFVEDNDVLGGSLDGTYGTALFCGLEACKEILAYPMELRANLNVGGDFGRQKAIAWLSLLGYKGGLWNYTSHGQGSVLHYTTA